MVNRSVSPQGEPQPVAYDTEGRPLYHHPPTQSAHQPAVQAQPHASSQQTYSSSPAYTNVPGHTSPQYVHWSRPIAIQQHEVPPEIQAKHEESVKKYPKLNLSRGEFVVKHVHRHPIGAVISGLVAMFLLLLIGAALVAIPTIGSSLGLSSAQYLPLIVIGAILMIMVTIGAWISIWVYNQNEFYLTNESVIQETQHSLFSRHEQTISLANIEDASYQQHGLMQYMFNYGLIRLSTKGDETTYRFPYASRPRDQVSVLNNAVEAFKNGRPITSLEAMQASRPSKVKR